MNDIIKCCKNCKNLITTEKNNRYKDKEYFCVVSGYFTHNVTHDVTKFRHLTPGGRVLPCSYEPRREKNHGK